MGTPTGSVNDTRPRCPPTIARLLRVASGLSQAEAARLAGVSRNTLSTVERFPGACTPAVAAKLAPVLGCDPSALTARPAR